MKTDMVKYYYKDLDTGVEVTSSKSLQFGWAVQFHVSKVTAVGNEQFAAGGNEYSVHCGGIAIKVKSDKLKRKDFLFLIGVI